MPYYYLYKGRVTPKEIKIPEDIHEFLRMRAYCSSKTSEGEIIGMKTLFIITGPFKAED